MGTIRLPNDFQDFLKLLNSERVEFLIVGGYAVAFHGHPRATGDMDVWISADRPNVERVGNVLRRFGFSDDSVAVAMRVDPGRIIRMGVPPLRIELLTGVSGVDFAACYERREAEMVDGIEVPFISREDLIENKRSAGRTKDLADVEELT